MTAPPDDMTTYTSAIIAALRIERDAALAREATLAEALASRDAALAQRNSEYDERMEHQAATVDVLKAMSASPGDAQPVFDLIADRARDICGGYGVSVHEFDGSVLHLRAYTGVSEDPRAREAYEALYPTALTREVPVARAIMERRVTRFDDFDVDPGLSVVRSTVRSAVAVPMMRGNAPVGGLIMGRRERGGFSDSQIELLKTFAEQAVIAITSAETYRALQERTAALAARNSEYSERIEQQSATINVLKVMSSTPEDTQPVFNLIVRHAAELCNGSGAGLLEFDGELVHYRSSYGLDPDATRAYAAIYPMPPTRSSIACRAILDKQIIHIRNMDAEPGIIQAARNLGIKSNIALPLMRDDTVIGVFVLDADETGGFSDSQIELLKTFAEQAVIAITSAETYRALQTRTADLQETLEYQTSTSDVLKVISRSAYDLKAVLQALLDTAARLCAADFGALMIRDGDVFRTSAIIPISPEHEAFVRRKVFVPSPHGSVVERTAFVRQITHIEDIATLSDYVASGRGFVVSGTALGVPLFLEGDVVGVFTLHRQRTKPFTDAQIILVSTFADQAVIAIENTRLITEQREALEQQTATAEVLQVINASPGNLTPVFDAMLEKAIHLCGSSFGSLATYDGEAFHVVAMRGVTPALAEFFRAPILPVRGMTLYRTVQGENVVHVADLTDDEMYRSGNPVRRALADLGGARTQLLVALRKDDALLGAFNVFRQDVRPFSDKQIALLKNFAAQAVIAMENARLLTEQQEALEQQTATAEVLQVINASPGNLAPVFDAMLEKALTLCGAEHGSLGTYDGDYFRAVASRGYPAAVLKTLQGGFHGLENPVTRPLFDGARFVHIPDLGEIGHSIPKAIAALGGFRTVLFVPLRKDGKLLGHISASRQEVRSFAAKEIALLENFAAQAVIAMENARLLDEVRQRQAELRVTFENMGDGVALFDETPSLVAWNHKFQDILDLPDGVLAERLAFPDYIRYLAERGEYGEGANPEEQIRRLTGQLGEVRAYERTRPDGRVIEIRRNPVPGGGFVLIFSDISERKRNEAEIRAARDAAEQASRAIEAAYRELKTAQASLIQAEKMASLGQLTAGIAHEIKNPLNFVNNFAALSVDLLDELKDAIAPAEPALNPNQRAEVDAVVTTLTGNLEKITEHGKRADGIVKAMLEHSRGSSGERRVIDLNALIDEALNLAYHGARAHDQSFNITLERDFGTGIAPIEVNPQDITRVFLNLFSNGFYATTRRAREGSTAGFVPTLKITTRDAGDAVEIRVLDNGTGIPAEIKDKLFQPFFTTKPTGEGTGLGLSITYDIVTKQHGGTITVDSEVSEFTEFIVTLPRQMFANGGGRA